MGFGMTQNIMIADRDDNFYDIYVFKNEVKIADIDEVVNNHKKEFIGEWTMESIEKAIINTFEVAEVIHCDYIKGNIVEV